MRRLLFLVVTLAACGGATPARGPAWPTPSATAEDGGESLEPRGSSAVAAAIERSEGPAEDKPEPEPAAPAAAPSAPSTDKPAAPSPPIADDVIISEEILIEIDD